MRKNEKGERARRYRKWRNETGRKKDEKDRRTVTMILMIILIIKIQFIYSLTNTVYTHSVVFRLPPGRQTVERFPRQTKQGRHQTTTPRILRVYTSAATCTTLREPIDVSPARLVVMKLVVKLVLVLVGLLLTEGAGARPQAGEKRAEGGGRNKRNNVICSSRDILEMANRVCDLTRRSAGQPSAGR